MSDEDEQVWQMAKAVQMALALAPTATTTPIVDLLRSWGAYDRDERVARWVYEMVARHRDRHEPFTKELINATRPTIT